MNEEKLQLVGFFLYKVVIPSELFATLANYSVQSSDF